MPIDHHEWGEVGTALFWFQVAMLSGIAAPWVALALALYFTPKDPPKRSR